MQQDHGEAGADREPVFSVLTRGRRCRDLFRHGGDVPSFRGGGLELYDRKPQGLCLQQLYDLYDLYGGLSVSQADLRAAIDRCLLDFFRVHERNDSEQPRDTVYRTGSASDYRCAGYRQCLYVAAEADYPGGRCGACDRDSDSSVEICAEVSEEDQMALKHCGCHPRTPSLCRKHKALPGTESSFYLFWKYCLCLPGLRPALLLFLQSPGDGYG